MLLNIEEIKIQIDNSGTALTTTDSFNKDMEVLKVMYQDQLNENSSLVDVGVIYFSDILKSNLKIEQDENYTTIKLI